MRTFARKSKAPKETPAKSTMRRGNQAHQNLEAGSMLQLQRSIGNEALVRLLQDQVGFSGDSADVQGVAARGLGGAGSRLPHLDQIQSSFGRHDIRGTRAHLGQEAADANRKMGAEAYTFGDRVGFSAPPSLHTAAHEAAHVVQQRSGVHLKNNVGEPGDVYERQADAVADLVVQGVNVEPLLDRIAGPADSHSTGAVSRAMQKGVPAVQMQEKPKSANVQALPEIPGFREMISRWLSIEKIKSAAMRALAKEYVNRPGRFETPDQIYYDTPYGTRVVPGIHEPTEQRVFDALMSATDLKKTGKGDKDTDWFWVDEPAAGKKTAGEKSKEIGKFAGQQAISKALDKTTLGTFEKGAATLGVEYGVAGKLSDSSVIEAISEPVANWIMKDVLLVSAKVAAKAIPIIGWLWLTYDVADLLISLNEPGQKELSPYQMESASIVAGVKAYLERKEQAAELKKATNEPFDSKKLMKPLQNDATIVRRR